MVLHTKNKLKNVSCSGGKYTSKEDTKQEIYEKDNVPCGCHKATKELQNKAILLWEVGVLSLDKNQWQKGQHQIEREGI